jgi:hypothetical protein
MAGDEVRADPPSALAYSPVIPRMKEPPTAPFGELEAAEFKAQDLPKALEVSRSLAGSTDPAVRAGALLRQARILRKMGRPADALAIYGALAAFTTISINGSPVDLLARRTRCLLLAEMKRTNEHRQEAAALDAHLGAGRWQLDRVGHEYVSAQLDQWLGSARRPHADAERLAAAVEWLHHRLRCNDAERGKVRPIAPRIARQKGHTTDERVGADVEIRQGRPPLAPTAPVSNEGAAGQERGLPRQRLALIVVFWQRGFEILDPLEPGGHLRVDHGVHDERARVGLPRQRRSRPVQPLRILGDDVENDVAVDEGGPHVTRPS